MLMKRRGQTLLELVIASGIIATTVIGAITLMIRTITLSQGSEQKVEASNFAREGIEAIRMIRDSNWLKIDQTLQRDGVTPFTGTAGTFLETWDDSHINPAGLVPIGMSNRYALRFNLATGWSIDICTIASCKVIYDHGDYDTQFGPVAGARATKYSREILVTSVTETIDIGGTNYPVAYLNVTSTVTWTASGSRTGSVQMKTRLYNWR